MLSIQFLGKKLRIRPRTFQIGMLFLIFSSMIVSFTLTLPEVKAQELADENGVIPINDRLIGVQISQIGYPTQHSEGAVWKPSWNEIRAEVATPRIMDLEMTDYPPIIDVVTGNNIYRRTIPFEFDMNVWSSLTIGDAFDGAVANGEYKWATVKIYKGEKLANDQPTYWGYSSNTKVDDTLAIPAGRDATTPTGNDGNNRFDTRYKTEMTTVTFPCYNLISYHPTEGWWGYQVSDFDQIASQLSTYYWSSNVDYNNYNVNLSVILDPLLGMPTNIDTTSGKLLFKDAWVRMGGFTIVQQNTETGVAATPARAISDYEIGGLSTSGMPSDAKQMDGSASTKPDKSKVVASVPSQDSGRSISGDIPVSYTDALATPFSQGLINKPSSYQIYSKELGKTWEEIRLDTAHKGEEQLNNLYNWEISIKNFRTTPELYLLKRTANIPYKEYWIDEQAKSADKVEEFDTTAITPSFLVGWYIRNTYCHLRVRVLIDVFCIYEMPIIHDSGDNSYLGTPTDVNGKMIWSKTPYGDTNFDYTWDDPTIGKWWDNLMKGLNENDIFNSIKKYLPYIIIGALALVVLYISSQSGGIGGRGGGKTTVNLSTGLSERSRYSGGQREMTEGKGDTTLKWIVGVMLAIIIVGIILNYI